jgi:curved DNA-binding protein CbpA
MKTLYDLLGARPDDDAEALRAAFRKAAKANHPDLRAGDPYAAIRFRQIAEAYETLRDAERRAAYDRLLQFEQRRLHIRSYPTRSIVSAAVTAVGLAFILAGYFTYAHFSTGRLTGAPARGAARIAAGQRAAPISANKPSELRDRLEPAPGRAPTIGGPAPKATALRRGVARVTAAFAVTAEQDEPKSVAEHSDRSAETQTLGHDSAQFVKALPSSGEGDSVGKSSPSDFATSDDKHDMKGPDTRNIDANDVRVPDPKMPETKMPRRPRMAAKLQTTSRANFEQASLENRNTCSNSQSCSPNVPPLFGVGF